MKPLVSANPAPLVLPYATAMVGGDALPAPSSVWRATLTIITLIGLLVRLPFINQPLKNDEALTAMRFAASWHGMWQDFIPNNHPLHSILVHYTMKWARGGEWGIRLPAFLAGVALIPAAAWAARRLYDDRAALLAAAWAAGSSALIDYSVNARGYSMIALCFMLLLGIAARLTSQPSFGRWAAFTAVGAIGFFTVPIMVYPCGMVGLWLLSSAVTRSTALPPRRFIAQLLMATAATIALTLLLYLPLIQGSGIKLVTFPEIEREAYSDLREHLRLVSQQTAALWTRDIPLALVALLIGGFVLGLVLHRRIGQHRVPPAAALIWCPLVVLIQRVSPFPRVWLFLLPLFFITASAGLVGLLTRTVRRGGEGETRRPGDWETGRQARGGGQEGRKAGDQEPRQQGAMEAGISHSASQIKGDTPLYSARAPRPVPFFAPSLLPSSPPSLPLSLLCILLAAFLGFRVYRAGSPIDSPETGAFPDAPAVAADLKRELQSGDSIVASKAQGHEFPFYLQRAHIRGEFMRADAATADRLLIAVKAPADADRATRELKAAGANPAVFSTPALLHAYPRSALYIAQRHAEEMPGPTTLPSTAPSRRHDHQ